MGRNEIYTSGSLAGHKRSLGDLSDDINEDFEPEVRRNKKKKKDKDDRENEVDETIKTLKEKHGSTSYTAMQYRIWAEMHVGGYHSSSDDPPTTTMFARAGGATPRRKTTADAVSQVISQLSSTLSPKLISPAPSTNSNSSPSPAKVIENCSKCYRQLGELKNLKQSGLLSEDECQIEREAIMNTLKDLGK